MPALRRGRCGGPLDGVLGLGCFAAEGLANPACLVVCCPQPPRSSAGQRAGGRAGSVSRGQGLALGMVRFQEGMRAARAAAGCVPPYVAQRAAGAVSAQHNNACACLGEERARAACA